MLATVSSIIVDRCRCVEVEVFIRKNKAALSYFNHFKSLPSHIAEIDARKVVFEMDQYF